ncbi:hypothetical protein ES705_18897 [subsurface metagenome]
MKLAKQILLFLLLSTGALGLKADTPLNNLNGVDDEVIIFPNPVTEGIISVISEKVIERIEILNIVGQKILTKEPEPSNSVKLKINNLKTGIYLVRISFTDNTSSIKRIWIR